MRSYRGEQDRQAMVELVCAFPEHTIHVIDLPYRLYSRALEDVGNVGLWEDDEGRLQAFVVRQPAFLVLDTAYTSAAKEDGIETLVLEWAIQHFSQLARERGHSFYDYIEVRENQVDKIAFLRQHGFMLASWHVVHMQRSLAGAIPEPQLLPGFTIRPLAGEKEVKAYVDLHQTVFDSTNMTAAWCRRLLQSPQYNPELNLVVVAPDGSLAAFCTCWLNQTQGARRGKEAQIEPLGTHPHFRQLGLARAIQMECFRRLKALGVDTIYVETHSFSRPALELYKAVGFRIVHKILNYQKMPDRVLKYGKKLYADE